MNSGLFGTWFGSGIDIVALLDFGYTWYCSWLDDSMLRN